MKKFLKTISFIGILLTILPPVLLLAGATSCLHCTKNFMLAGMIIWFSAAIPWLGTSKKPLDSSTQDQI